MYSNGSTEEWLAGDQSDVFQAVVDGEVQRLRTVLDTGVDPSLPDSEVRQTLRIMRCW